MSSYGLHWRWPIVSLVAGFFPVLALLSPVLAQNAGMAHRTAPVLTVTPRLDDGPKFFTIRQLVDRQEGKPQRNEREAQSWPLRLSTLDPDNPAAMAGESPYLGAGYQLFPSFQTQASFNWRRIQTDWMRDRTTLEQCERNPARCPRAGSAFLSMVRQARPLDRDAQISLINARVNASVRYQSDVAQHSEADVWSTPLRTLAQAGDCEDYAIAKFFLLKELGVAEEDMRIVLLRDHKARDDHAVLAVRGQFAWHLLDNRHNTLDSDANTPHSRPVIALNSLRQDLFAAPFIQADDSDAATSARFQPAQQAGADRLMSELSLRGTR